MLFSLSSSLVLFSARLRCALLQCPFGDMNRVVSAVVKNVRKAERSITTLHYSKSEPVSSVIDELAKTVRIIAIRFSLEL